MNTKPILFSTEMVQAILDGRKTQTRRVIKPQPALMTDKSHFNFNGEYYLTKEQLLQKANIQKGNLLWVRETFRIGAWNEEGEMAFDYKASPDITNTPWCFMGEWYEKETVKIVDELDAKGIKPNKKGHYQWEPGQSPLNWKPSIFMPKEACRIFLEVTDVRVERLHDISEEDAKAEGIANHHLLKTEGYKHYTEPSKFLPFTMEDAARTSFFSLWMSINGTASLDENPWVWVYDFKKVEKPAGWPANVSRLKSNV